jgi:hypothetical protein
MGLPISGKCNLNCDFLFETIRGNVPMRNILMTVMMMIVVALLFTSIINNGDTGMRNNIKLKGDTANTNINALNAGS